MFWGLNLKPNRKYSQTTEKSFHISQAALNSEISDGGPTQIFISSENQRFLICTLRKEVCEQVMLDLNFSVGNEICFQSLGSGNVTLSGYVMDDGDDYLNGDEEEEEDVESGSETEEVDLRDALNAKKAKNKKAEKVKTSSKALKGVNEEDEDDSNSDSENEVDDEEDSDVQEDEEEVEDEDEDEDEEEEEDDDSEDEETQQPKAKQAKLEKPEKQQNGVVKQKDQQAEKKSKKELKKEKHQQQKQQQEKQPKTGSERILSGGVKVVDLRVGGGAEAKSGKRAHVYYEGRLLSNNKVFDSLKSGAGFKFNLGRGEVIKGWDIGVVGMKVGGKRRITCPAHMAYGSRGSAPAIPPNSTLIFEVELKSVN